MRRARAVGWLWTVYSLALLLFAGVARGAEDLVAVPDVLGKPAAQARATLSSSGFTVATVEVDGAPVDSVAAQTPAAGSLLPRDGVVVLDVRVGGADAGPAPKAVGLSLGEASTAFGGLYDLAFQPVPGAAADRGRIVAQSPTMGAALRLRGRLTLSFVPDTTLPASVTVPGATSMSPADALQAVADAGLHARVAKVVLPGTPADLVVGQSPLPGTETARYATVILVVTVAGDGPAGTADGAPVVVPNLSGMTESAARSALTAAGLDLEIEWVDGAPADTLLVQGQTPAAGANAPAGSAVRAQIVKYAPPLPPSGDTPATKVVMPDLLGLAQDQAEALLSSLGLVGNPIFEETNGVPPLRVFAQQAQPGSLVDVGTSVAFRVSKPAAPPQATPMPNFYGRTKGDALALASQAGVSVAILEIVTATWPPHRVYSQSLPAYATVPPGTLVTLKLARPPQGPTVVPVPDLDGLFAAQAIAKLSAVGLGSNAIEVITVAHPAFRVYGQNPAPGTPWPAGSTVTFKVAKSPLNWKTVPPLDGLTKGQATAAVLAAGLQPQAQDVFAFGKPIGKVFWQDPAPGTGRPGGSIVAFKVAMPLLVNVPQVVGKPTAVAIQLLQAANLVPDVKTQVALGKPAGIVFDQNPNFGASVAPGTVVQIRVPIPLGVQVQVPGLVGMSKAQAEQALTALGLVPNVEPFETIFAAHWGQVVGQNPGPAQLVVVGASVTIQVGKPKVAGPQLVSVPNVLGFPQAAATNAMLAKGFVPQIVEVSVLQPPFGTVGDQTPNGATLLPVGSQVVLRIRKFAAAVTVKVPNLYGMTPVAAKNALQALGLQSLGVMVNAPFQPNGRVWKQFVAANTMVLPNTVVKWYWTP